MLIYKPEKFGPVRGDAQTRHWHVRSITLSGRYQGERHGILAMYPRSDVTSPCRICGILAQYWRQKTNKLLHCTPDLRDLIYVLIKFNQPHICVSNQNTSVNWDSNVFSAFMRNDFQTAALRELCVSQRILDGNVPFFFFNTSNVQKPTHHVYWTMI